MPIAQAGNGHPDFYDRFWFNGYTEDLFFALAMGSYPNRGVIDAAFSVVHDGVQRSVFASGPGAARPHRHGGRPDHGRHRRADAHDEAARSTHRSTGLAGRPHVRRPDRRLRGAAPDPLQRTCACSSTSPGPRSSGQLVGDDHDRRRHAGARRAHGVGLQGPLVGRPPGRRAGADGAAAAARRSCASCGRRSTSPTTSSTTSCSRTPTACRGRRAGRCSRSSARRTTTVGPEHPLRARRRTSDLGIDWEPGLRRSRQAELTFRRGRRRAGAHRPRAAAHVPHERRRLHPPDVGPRSLARRARRRRRGRRRRRDRRHRAPPPPRAAGDAGDVGRPRRPRRARADRHRRRTTPAA